MIKRYAAVLCMDESGPYVDIQDDDTGPWVKFEDHEKSLVPLTAEIHCLRADNKALDQEYEARRLERDKAIADKRELVDLLEQILRWDCNKTENPNGPCWDKELSALIAKHKEGDAPQLLAKGRAQ